MFALLILCHEDLHLIYKYGFEILSGNGKKVEFNIILLPVGVYSYLNIGHTSMTETYTVKTEFNPSNSFFRYFPETKTTKFMYFFPLPIKLPIVI